MFDHLNKDENLDISEDFNDSDHEMFDELSSALKDLGVKIDEDEV